jgi:AraC-like DNA-binding protein
MAFGGYKDLQDYLERRARAHGYTLSALSQEMGWAISYLTSAAREQFRMSVKRCERVAEFFGDDPAICKTLAGHMEPPPEDDLVDAIGRYANSLRPNLQRTLLELAGWLLDRQSEQRDGLMRNQLYVETPDGKGRAIEVDGDPLTLSEHELRVAVKTALNIALSRD